MRLKHNSEKRHGENILPLINVVFLMLIFFLISATIKPFAELDVKPPEVEIGTVSEYGPDTVFVDFEGRIFFDGALLSTKEFTQRLNFRREMGNMPRLKVLVDRAFSSRRLVDVLAAATAAGAQDISLIAVRGIGS